MKILIILILVCVAVFLVLKRKKIGSAVDGNERTNNFFNYTTNDNAQYLMMKYEKMGSDELVALLRGMKNTTIEYRIIQKILNDRNVPFNLTNFD